MLIDATVTVSGEVTGRLSARGGRPIDTEWLRTELGLTAPLSERAWTLTR